MKISAIVCAVLAGSLGFGTVASAQQWNDRGDHGQRRAEQRQDSRDGRRDERRDDRHDDHRDRRGWNNRDDRGARQGWNNGGEPSPYGYMSPRLQYREPGYHSAPRYYRGAVLPYQYRSQPYYVSNWQAHPGLYAPAHGQQWVNVDGQFLLVALATGLIANALINQ